MEYRILGPLEVVAGEQSRPLGGAKQRGLLALLVLRAGEVVAADRLVEELWQGRPSPGSPVTLRSHLSRLRRILERAAGRPVLMTRAPGYVLEADPEEIDAARFERLVRDGRAALAAGRLDEAARLLRAGQDLWRGPLCADIADLDAVRTERARLAEVRLEALEARIEADLATGRHIELVGELDALLADHPLREALHAKRMLALYRCGRQAEALAAFQEARKLLTEELGIEPGAALQNLHRAMLRQEPGLDGAVRPPALMALMASVALSEAKPAEPFVGRAEELALLRTALTEARAGRGRVVLLAGEPGIGKTRTAQELAAEACTGGFEVLWGRAWEEAGAPAFWPWVQALRTWVERLEPAALRAACGPEAPVLAQLVAAIAERIPELAAPPRLEAALVRFRLFDAVTRVLCRTAAVTPVLLVLDDLHRADVPSLRLLQFLAREVAGAHVLVVSTYRDTDEGIDPVFRDVLAELWREPVTQHIGLSGLSAAEINRYVEHFSGQPAADSLTAELRERTGGNPFFLREVVRLLQDEEGLLRGRELGDQVPRGVRAAVERRLGVLTDQARGSLALAAVAGREFSLEVVQAARDGAAEPLLDQLEQASRAGLIYEVSDSPGRFCFSHVLIRDTLYTSLSGVRRARLHLQVAEALERFAGAGSNLHAAELAHHFRQAGQPAAGRRAASYAARAGEQALAVYAYEEAIRQFRLALDQTGDPPGQADLLLRLAKAQTRAGDMSAGKQTCHRAAAVARDLGQPGQLARAAVLLHDDEEFGAFEPQLKMLLEEALAGLATLAVRGADEPALRAKVLARLAMVRSWQPASDRAQRESLEGKCRALAGQAVTLAREVKDPAVLVYALGARNYVYDGPEHTEERLKIAEEMLRVAESFGDRAWQLQARRWRVITCAELGCFDEFDAEVDAYATTAAELRMPNYQAWAPLWRGLRAVMAGDFDAAERLGAQALAVSPDPPSSVLQGYGAMIWTLRHEQGRLAELEPILSDYADRLPGHSGWRAALTLSLAAVGRRDDARRHLEGLARDGFLAVPHDRAWVLSMCQLAETSALISDSDRAGVLYDLLLPYGRDCAVAYGVAATGPVALHLGSLAELLGRAAAARRHYELAAEISRRIGARTWLDRARRRLSGARPAGR